MLSNLCHRLRSALLYAFVVPAGLTVEAPAARPASDENCREQARIIYVGEIHSAAADHRFELRLVQHWLRSGMDFAIGWEMFDELQQPILDDYASGRTNLRQLLIATSFQKSWGVYSPVYRKILQLAQTRGIENIALNAPPAMAHKIAQGLPLTRDEARLRPQGFRVPAGAYQNFVQMMGAHPGQPELKRYFAAQNLWDQTMASRILWFCRTRPSRKVLVLCGRGHVEAGFGVPALVAERGSELQCVVLPRPGAK